MDCSYCFLTRTFRRLPTGKKFVMYPLDKVKKDLIEVLLAEKKPQMFNAGELTDSLEYTEWLDELVPVFNDPNINQVGHKLLLLTKRTNVEWLLNHEVSLNVVFSMTLNAQKFIDTFERLTPSLDERLKALKQVKDAGWETRVRIDPIVIPQFQYQTLCEALVEIRPKRVTLGTWRFYSYDSWFPHKAILNSLVPDGDDGRIRIEFTQRRMIYAVLRGQLWPITVGICKETAQMYTSLGLRKVECNCQI